LFDIIPPGRTTRKRARARERDRGEEQIRKMWRPLPLLSCRPLVPYHHCLCFCLCVASEKGARKDWGLRINPRRIQIQMKPKAGNNADHDAWIADMRHLPEIVLDGSTKCIIWSILWRESRSSKRKPFSWIEWEYSVHLSLSWQDRAGHRWGILYSILFYNRVASSQSFRHACPVSLRFCCFRPTRLLVDGILFRVPHVHTPPLHTWVSKSDIVSVLFPTHVCARHIVYVGTNEKNYDTRHLLLICFFIATPVHRYDK